MFPRERSCAVGGCCWGSRRCTLPSRVLLVSSTRLAGFPLARALPGGLRRPVLGLRRVRSCARQLYGLTTRASGWGAPLSLRRGSGFHRDAVHQSPPRVRSSGRGLWAVVRGTAATFVR